MSRSEFDEASDPSKNPATPKKYIDSKKVSQWRHFADTQRVLAVAIIAATLVLYGILVTAVICKWVDKDTFVALIAALAPLQALAAATVGFFFGKKD